MSGRIKVVVLDEARDARIAGYIAGEAEGAIPNGKRIRKVDSDEGDATPLGHLGTVLSSIRWDEAQLGEPLPLEARGNPLFYFVVWDPPVPQVPVGIMGWKVEAVDEGGE